MSGSPSTRANEIRRMAVTLIHQIAKELDWLRSLGRRLPERLDEPERARRDASRIAALAEDVAVRARAFLDEVAEGSLPPRRERPLEAVVAAAVETVSRRFHSRRITRRIAPDLGRVRVDEALESVLVELLDNALRATRAGGSVEVEAHPVEGGLEVAVSDRGCGMSPDALARCLEPGFSARADDPGHGIGLAVSRETIAALGGALELQSERGAGTRAAVRLPVRVLRARRGSASASPARASRLPEPSGSADRSPPGRT